MRRPYELDERLDPDLWPHREDPDTLRKLLTAVCTCGHERAEHMAATGALGSFGGSACDSCWSCGTFVAVDDAPPRVPSDADRAWARQVLGR